MLFLKVFNETTIFFCDIVGFTNIASDSTANQIIDFLNDLYSLFDERLDNYDVYKVYSNWYVDFTEFENDGMFDLYIWKVETIGDAYMVASGVPVPNGNMHAMEVSMMSLDLLAKILTFEIQVILTRYGCWLVFIIFLSLPLACLKRFTKTEFS